MAFNQTLDGLLARQSRRAGPSAARASRALTCPFGVQSSILTKRNRPLKFWKKKAGSALGKALWTIDYMNAVAACTKAQGLAREVLLCLAAFADHDGCVFPDIHAVALACWTNPKGANQAIQELINSGELRLTRFSFEDPDGDVVPAAYQILAGPTYGSICD
jgi:hypothetical protein